MQRMKGVEVLARIKELEDLDKVTYKMCSYVSDGDGERDAKHLTDCAGVDQSLFYMIADLRKCMLFELARLQKAIYEAEVEV